MNASLPKDFVMSYLPSVFTQLNMMFVRLSGATSLRDNKCSDLLAQWISASPFIWARFTEAMDHAPLPAVHKTKVQAIRTYAEALFPAPYLIGLLLELGALRSGFRVLSQYISRRPDAYTACTGLPFPRPMPTLGARLKPNVVPAKLFQYSRLSGRNKKSSKFIYPPTKPTRTWWQNMLFASLGGPRWYAHICCPARCHVKKTCFQKQFLLEHHWNTARTSYWNVAGTSTLQQEQSTRKGKMVTYIVM